VPAKRFSVEQIVAKLREAEKHQAHAIVLNGSTDTKPDSIAVLGRVIAASQGTQTTGAGKRLRCIDSRHSPW